MRAVSFLVAGVAAAGCYLVLFLARDSSPPFANIPAAAGYFLRHQDGDVPVPDVDGSQWRHLDHRPSSFGTQELVLRPDYATYVSKAEPDTNFRRDPFVEVDDDPDRKDIIIGFSGNSFLSQVKTVVLKMDCINESDDAGTVYESDEHMSKYVTWDSRPSDNKSHLTKVGSVGPVSTGKTTKVDVSDLISFGRLHSEITLVIRPESANGAKFDSDSIKLVVRYGGKNEDGEDDDGEDDEAKMDDDKTNDDDDESIGRSSPFQLMMWWERNYFWQETFSRRRWCATCGKGEGKRCKEGEHVRIVQCNSKDKVQHWVRDGSRICAYTDKSLCWDYRTRDYTLRRRKSSATQDFLARPFFSIRKNVNKSYRFELRRRTKPGCTTQLHHPKKYELLMSRRCELARNSKTSYWVAIVPKINGH